MRTSFLRRSALVALAVFSLVITSCDQVTNIAETEADSDASLTASMSVAQSFRTGSHSQGYTLLSIDVRFQANVGATELNSLKVEIWSNHSSNRPGAKLYELVVPAQITAGSTIFAAPADAALDRNTTYWFVVWADPIINGLKTTESDDQAGTAGWTIGDAYRYATDNPPTHTSTWNTPSDSRTLIITVNGLETPKPQTVLDQERLPVDTSIDVNGSETPKPQTVPDLERLPVDSSMRIPDNEWPTDSRRAYCYLGVGTSMTEYVRYPDGRIVETTRQSDAVRSAWACR